MVSAKIRIPVRIGYVKLQTACNAFIGNPVIAVDHIARAAATV